ncbi:MAG: aa3-type cytochrome c oxidase subunit IV [Paracoccus sp. (in: a-proteobacteria)]|nr:aa3-type cytochrome c oxidase subunit IV [Paracoccus sp. (in: a-proteobacteria)]
MAQNDQIEHKHGSMDIREQQRTFVGFLRFSAWACALAGVVLIFMALANA